MYKSKVYLKPLIIILSVYLVFASVAAVCGGLYVSAWNKHTYSPESYGSYEWNEQTRFDLSLFPSLVIDGNADELKIMQIADPQLKFGDFTQDVKTMELLAAALDAEKPDIAVCTGDLTLSVFTYHAYKVFADFMESRRQYWTVVYGNHDSQFDCSKYTLYTLLSEYEYCLFDVGPSNIKGESNFLINVFRGSKSAENLAYSLVMLDSNMYPEGDDVALTDWVYDWLGEDQIAWYEWAVNGLRSVNSAIETTMFFHIPIKEYADMYYADILAKGGTLPEGVDASALKSASGVTGIVAESDKNPTELMDEGYNVGIFYQGKNTGMFDKIKQLNCTKAVFAGHDHVNTMKGYYDGIYLGYGLCCGYHTYPYFQKDNILLKIAGLSDRILFNGENWKDENGNAMEKGVTIINIKVAGNNYGQIDAKDVFASKYL